MKKRKKSYGRSVVVCVCAYIPISIPRGADSFQRIANCAYGNARVCACACTYIYTVSVARASTSAGGDAHVDKAIDTRRGRYSDALTLRRGALYTIYRDRFSRLEDDYYTLLWDITRFVLRKERRKRSIVSFFLFSLDNGRRER